MAVTLPKSVEHHVSLLWWMRLPGTNKIVLFVWFPPASLTPVQIQDPAVPGTNCPWETSRESSSEASMEDGRGKYPVERYLMDCSVSS